MNLTLRLPRQAAGKDSWLRYRRRLKRSSAAGARECSVFRLQALPLHVQLSLWYCSLSRTFHRSWKDTIKGWQRKKARS